MTNSDAKLCLGMISGTSVDGIDVAITRIAGHGQGATLDLVAFETVPYPDDLRAELLGIYDDTANAAARLCSLNFAVGEQFAAAALKVCRTNDVDAATLEVIGSHGQTVWHQPAADPGWLLSTPSTLQIGEPAVIAARTGVTTIGDFRVADMAAGGQGAPLAPYMDWVVFTEPVKGTCVQNIGGIGNVTWLPPGATVDDVRAFDTGPGNILIDGVMTLLTNGAQTYDRDGAVAAAGAVDDALLAGLLRDPYLDQPPPKTTGREYYGQAMCRDLLAKTGLAEGALTNADPATRTQAASLIATVTAYTARSIADAYRRWLPGDASIGRVLVNGGGSRNPTLMRMLGELLAPVPVTATDEAGVNADAKEAMLFALMAHDTLAGLPTNVPGATGARRAVPLGKICQAG